MFNGNDNGNLVSRRISYWYSSFMDETLFVHRNSFSVYRGVCWWHSESAECRNIVHRFFKIVERTSTMIATVGSACGIRIWRQHEWRDWFWAAEATLGKVANSTITRKWKWWFVNGWKFKSVSCNATEFLNLYRLGIHASVCLGITLTNNDVSVEEIRYA